MGAAVLSLVITTAYLSSLGLFVGFVPTDFLLSLVPFGVVYAATICYLNRDDVKGFFGKGPV